MAEVAEEQPTHAQMIAEMQKAGFTPSQTEPAPTAQTHEQMIAEMKAAGFVPGGQQDPKLAAMDKMMGTARDAQGNLDVMNSRAFGATGSDATTVGQALESSINNIPLASGAVGGAIAGPIGAGQAAVLGSAGTDALNHFIFGKDKPLMDSLSDATNQGALAMTGEAAIQKLSQAGAALAKTSVGSKVGELISAVPAQVIKAYADGAARIKAALANVDPETATYRMAQAAKEQYGESIAATRSLLNDQIADGLKDSTAKIDAAPIIARLESAKNALNPKFDADQISQINDLILKAKSAANMPAAGGMPDAEAGKMTIQVANQFKKHLQEVGFDSFKDNAAQSTLGTSAANAAKNASGVARDLIDAVAPDAVVAANQKLSTLHKLEDNMKKSLMNPQDSAQSLIDAARRTTEAGKKSLADLKDTQAITGTNMVQPAQDISAAKSLGEYNFGSTLRTMGQPLVKGAIDMAGAVPGGVGAGVAQGGQTLYQVIHGNSGVNSLQKPGGTP